MQILRADVKQIYSTAGYYLIRRERERKKIAIDSYTRVTFMKRHAATGKYSRFFLSRMNKEMK